MPVDTEKAIKELVAKGIKLPPQPKVLVELQKKLSSKKSKVPESISF